MQPYMKSAMPRAVLTIIMTTISIDGMTRNSVTRARRVTANLPARLLDDAMEATGHGITDTIIRGLELIRRSRAHEKAMALRGKVKLVVDVDASRERRRR
jgi:hypothetical protein